MTQQAKASGEGLDGTVWTGACKLPACGRDSLLPGKVVHDSAFFFGALAGGSPAEGIYIYIQGGEQLPHLRQPSPLFHRSHPLHRLI
jgi:hypothetical protein